MTPNHKTSSENNGFIGCQLLQMSRAAYMSILTFNTIMDGRDYVRFVTDMNDKIRGRKLIEKLQDDPKQILVIIFYPEVDSTMLDNRIRQVLADCSPNVHVTF